MVRLLGLGRGVGGLASIRGLYDNGKNKDYIFFFLNDMLSEKKQVTNICSQRKIQRNLQGLANYSSPDLRMIFTYLMDCQNK